MQGKKGNREQGTGNSSDTQHSALSTQHSPTPNHWLGIRLIGTKSNRDGIGARVVVTAGGRSYTQDHQLAGGYLSAHDPRLHFGLGQANAVEKIVVHWPSGRVDTIQSVPADQYIEVIEGKGRTR